MSSSMAWAACLLLAGGDPQARADEGPAVSVRKGVRIPMRDGIHLGATIFTPEDLPNPLPAVFCFTPYGADYQAWRGHWYAKRGYAVATVDVRGCGRSEGVFRPFENDGPDGHDVVEWLARQPWSNGKVAMFGWSYLGWSQWSTLKEFPPHLETIVPGVSTYPGTEGIPRNRNICLPHVMSWLNEIEQCSGRPSLKGRIFFDAKCELYRKHLPFRTLDTLHGKESPAFQTWMRHPAVDAYWDAMNPSDEDYARIDKPILTVTGHFDADQTGAMTHYRRHLRHAPPEARKKHHLIIGPWDHAGCSDSKVKNAGLTFDKACLINNLELHRQWYDWTLKGGPKPAFLEKNVAYYVMGEETWKYADSLEAIPTEPVRLYLVSDREGARTGTLDPKKPARPTSGAFIYDPLDTRPGEFEIEREGEPGSYNIMETNARSQRYAESVRQFGNGLIYHSEPFPKDTELTGYTRLVAWITLDVPDTDFMVTLHEIAPDGTSIQLTDDALRARYRESSREGKPVVPGEMTRYEFKEFWFFSRRIAKGSRLRLVFWSPNSIHLEKNYNGGGEVAGESGKDARTAHIILHHDPRQPSYLEIPAAKTP